METTTDPTNVMTVEETWDCLAKLGYCGCMGIRNFVPELRKLLEWCADDSRNRPLFETIYPNHETYYLVVGMMESLGLLEHGSAIRYPWLTPDGHDLLDALRTHSLDDLEPIEDEQAGRKSPR